MSEVFGIVGWKNSGKTTLVAALVQEFTKRGLVVSTIKNSHHSFEIDKPGTDSHSHRQAGAHEVAIVSQKRWAVMHEVATDGEAPTLPTMIAKLAPCDLILVEGFKASDIQKIESVRQGSSKEAPLYETNDTIIGVATDVSIEKCDKPQFDLNDILSIADFIADHCGLVV